jgi:hypothetical protein
MASAAIVSDEIGAISMAAIVSIIKGMGAPTRKHALSMIGVPFCLQALESSNQAKLNSSASAVGSLRLSLPRLMTHRTLGLKTGTSKPLTAASCRAFRENHQSCQER